MPDLVHGLGTDDTYCFPQMHEASAHVVGASVEAARAVWEGDVLHAANIAGGLHHAMPRRASGFCVYNDPAIAIQWLLDHGAERVAYVDVDVHHGDGVQAVFYDDPRVLTVSLHESPTTLVPRHRQRGGDRRTGRRRYGGQRRRCRRGRAMPAGCGRSTRSCRTW